MSETEYITVPTELLQLLSTEQAWHYHIVPKSADNGSLTLYIDENNDPAAVMGELEMLFGKSIAFEPVSSDKINRTLGKYYRRDHQSEKALFSISGKKDDFLVALIGEAKNLKSSDIHLEAYEDRCRIRFRIDGMMVERYIINKEDYPGLVNKIKIKANMDIAERRLPQDGRIYFEDHGNKFDIRVSVLPSLHGEKVVMRLLSNDATDIELSSLGFAPGDLERYLEGVRKPNGIVLISGPTGSGKTTTLYATLKLLNKETINILTIEDPIEYTLEGINQVQLRESIGLTFASALRTFLRQDPDIIMLGEIRDKETASMAIRAALTGHLVLSTIHTNSAWGTISRLIDMGVPPFLLANTMNTSTAQRLVRLLCPSCKTRETFDSNDYPSGFVAPQAVKHQYFPAGCDHCFYTGYKGRTAIYEIIPIDRKFSEYIKNNKFDVSNELKAEGIRTLAENAFDIFAQGNTSLEEIYPILLNQ